MLQKLLKFLKKYVNILNENKMTGLFNKKYQKKSTAGEKITYIINTSVNSISIKEITVNIKTMKKCYLDSTEFSTHKIILPSTKTK